MDTFQPLSFLAIILLLAQGVTADVGRTNRSANDPVMRGGIIGAIVDKSSRFGKEQKVAMEMAIMDVNEDKTGQSCGLHMTNSQREPYQTVVKAWDLINKQKVKAILLPHTWEEASLVAEIGNQAKIPVLSIADSTPLWATKRWPFLLQASPDQNAQMKAIAAIVDSWEWHQVTIIYEDIDSFRSGVIPYLSDAMQEIGAEISNLVALSPFDSSSLSTELERLKGEQCRVFLVHLSLPLAMQFFVKAKEMNMMETNYVWITTNPFTSLVHSLNASIISSMQGTIGVKSYYPKNDPHFHDFHPRFRKRFSLENPEEDNHEPGTLAMQTYDVVWTVCLAMRERSNGGQQLLNKIMLSKFNGLGGNVQFIDRKVAPAQIFQIINVFGKSYNDLGFWLDGWGFSKTIDDRALYKTSMSSLGQVFWPGGPRTTPSGWTPPSTAKPLRIAVPTQSTFKQYVNVEHDPLTSITNYTGFAIDLFRETIASLPFHLTYNLTPFDGNYDEMVEQVYLKKFDAVVGDVAIVAKRYQHVEFTHPYTESGLVMIVPVRTQNSNRAWLFVKPFTKAMWVLVGAISVYNSFVVWLIERKHHPELKASFFIQMGVVLCSAFTTLFSLQGGKLRSNLSRMAMMVWLFVSLVLTQTYVANLTSILTVRRLEPTVTDVESLRNGNEMVGYLIGSFVENYLVEVLNFHQSNIKTYDSAQEYANALRRQEIAAVFLEAPLAKLFLAKYCKEFITAGPTYKVGGFGFVFPRGSPLVPYVTKALLNVSESGRLRYLENNMIASEKCSDGELVDEMSRLSPSSFWVLFMFTGSTSTISLLVYVVCNKRFGHKIIRRLASVVMRRWGHHKETFPRKVRDKI